MVAPISIGDSAVELQRQPLSAFWKAKAFSIRMRRDTGKLSRLDSGDDDLAALPSLMSQQEPVQLEAIGLHAANGDSTIISTCAVTVALCSATWLLTSITRLTRRKSSQVLAA